jgi:hypothetical protein
METKAELMGVSKKFWVVLGAFALVTGGLVICALIALMYGLDIGVGIN